MARSLHKLTDVYVRSTKLKAGRHSDGGNLYLDVAPSGSKSWTFMWMREGRQREMGLGSYPAIGLAAARDRAAEARAILASGGDPIQARDAASDITEDPANSMTFAEAAERYIASKEPEWRNAKHRYQWEQTLGDSYCKKLRQMQVADITFHDVLEVLEPVWRDKQETASRLRGRMERVFAYARVQGWRTGDNPALWNGLLKEVLPKRQKLQRGHLPAMNWRDVPAFVQRLRTAEALAARALELCILTAARSNEVLGARWGEVDFDAKIWTIPAERTKIAKAHDVPLSDRADDLLQQLHDGRTSDFIFPSNSLTKPRASSTGKKILPASARERPLSNMAMLMLLRRMKVEGVTVHGFRSAFRDWCGDATDYPRELAEAALAHRVGNSVEQAYRRSTALEKRRKLMQDWADYVGGVAKAEPQDEPYKGAERED